MIFISESPTQRSGNTNSFDFEVLPISAYFYDHTKKQSQMRQISIVLLSLLSYISFSQEGLTYQQPPQEILELVDVQLAPAVQLDENREVMVLLYRDAYETIEQLSRDEMRLAGLRIDSKTNIGSRVRYYNNLKIRKLENGDATPVQVEGLPAAPRLTNFSWSPDQQRMAFTHTTNDGVELWVLDIGT